MFATAESNQACWCVVFRESVGNRGIYTGAIATSQSPKLLEILHNSAAQILNQHSISEEIEACCDRVTAEFITKYCEGSEGVSNYIKDIF